MDGIRVARLEDAGEVIQPLADRILGRVVLEDVVDPALANNSQSAPQLLAASSAGGVTVVRMRVRSPTDAGYRYEVEGDGE